MTNSNLARVANLDVIRCYEEKKIFGITQTIIEQLNQSLKDDDTTELCWRVGAQHQFIKSDATHFEVPKSSDGRKELFRQRFNRLRGNVISRKN